MPYSRNDLDAIAELFAPVLGRKVWGAYLGYGAHLPISFGAAYRVASKRGMRMEGAWMFGTDACGWHVEARGGVPFAYEDHGLHLGSAALGGALADEVSARFGNTGLASSDSTGSLATAVTQLVDTVAAARSMQRCYVTTAGRRACGIRVLSC